MIMINKQIRENIKSVYEKETRQISTCFNLIDLKRINVICVASDAPYYIREIALNLQKELTKSCSELQPKILTISPLFGHRSHNYVEQTFQNLEQREDKLPDEKCLILATAEIIHELLTFVRKRARQAYVFLDIDAYRYDFVSPFNLTDQSGLEANKVLPYMAYKMRQPINARYLIAYASSYEVWGNLFDLWHQLKVCYGYKANIIYVDDIQPWTSLAFGNTIFHKFEKFMKKLKVDTKVTQVPATSPNIVSDIVGGDKGIAFLIQSKTCNKTYEDNIRLFIRPEDFNQLWSDYGRIEKQFLCQSLRETTTLDLKLPLPKRFHPLELKWFWWNYKVKLSFCCWQTFLSEFNSY